MKKEIHPEYAETTITCACGEVIHTRSTKKNIRVEICSKCHPFFTGKQKLIDTAGRIERFRKKYEKFHLKDVSFSLEKGYIMGFIGSNGAGTR